MAINFTRLLIVILACGHLPHLVQTSAAQVQLSSGHNEIPDNSKFILASLHSLLNLRYLVGNIGKIDGREGLEERLLGELRDLARDLESASKQNKLEAFFNSDDDVSSLDSHNESLNFIIADLTVALANATPQNVDKIRKDIDTAVKQLHASVNNSPGGQVTHMTGNEIEMVAGRYHAGNEVYGKNVKMVLEIHNNKIGFIGGDAFSGNKVSEFPP